MTRVFIIANGEPDYPNGLAALIDKQDIVICADGGSNHAIKLGIKPTIVVGDMDSISQTTLDEFEKQGIDIRKFPKDKDASDLELALKAAVDYNPTETLCASILGRREDHSLTNTFLLGRYASIHTRVTILGSTWRAQFVTPAQSAVFAGAPGDILSLTPMIATVSGVCVDGVKWPLENSTLPWGSSRTVSNEFTGTTATVSLTEGLILAFHYRLST